MVNTKIKTLLAMAAALALPGLAKAANVQVGTAGTTTVITTSTTWTANNTYNLAGLVYVAPGATLTIEAGTVIKSVKADQGSLAITRGAKIIANGTPTKPIIFTSSLDDMVTAKNLANEWGNITIMGNALIGASHLNDGTTVRSYDENPTFPAGTSTNTANTGAPTGLNKATMEGLVAAGLGDPRVLFGGNNDNDDSGSLSYVSIRYGGKVLALTDELNGLSLGGVGRETDIHHVDIFANVDDGIEIWGGTVNLKYISIWNVGDDSFDVDQGWRGKAQFGLIVQGYSVPAAQGSGIGDNAIEIDGAERNDAQPVTTANIYNFTVIGQPFDPANPGLNYGDHGIALRDSARVQIHNSIFMDIGENVLREEASESGTGAWRYGTFGTLSYAATWTTAYSEMWNTGNAATGGHPNAGGLSSSALQALYAAQSSGKLNEINDSVFYNNKLGAAYSNANVGFDAVSALVGNNNVNNVKEPPASPIKLIERGGPVLLQGNTFVMRPVTRLDPRAANSAVTSVGSAPADGFFTPAPYRGAFSKDVNWAKGWTAASQYGIYTEADTASAPPVSASTLVTIVSFNTVAGVVYTVESSSDGKNWSPVATVIGDGTTKAISGLTTVDPSKAYRAIAQ